MSDNTYTSREAWLTAAALGLRPLFERVGHPLIVPVRLSVGFPSKGALSMKRRTVGECWTVEASSDGHAEIMVSPLIDDSLDVIGTVAHELGHAVLGQKVGHKRPFANLMDELGMEGKATATVPGPRFRAETSDLLDRLGPFPHGRLIPLLKEKKEKIVVHRCVCPKCGYVARVIRRWLETAGPPLCPVDRVLLEET